MQIPQHDEVPAEVSLTTMVNLDSLTLPQSLCSPMSSFSCNTLYVEVLAALQLLKELHFFLVINSKLLFVGIGTRDQEEIFL